MRNKKLRDRITITRDSDGSQLPNGDISSAFATIGTYWCNAINSDSSLVDRSYDAPQFEFDYEVTMRKKTAIFAGITKGDSATLEGVTGTFQINNLYEENLTTYKLQLSATDN